MTRLKLITAIMIIGSPITAQNAVERMIELPAHAWLQTLRENENSTLSPFETDGCSGYQSQTWEFIATQIPSFGDVHEQHPPWENCCITHDRAYHIGGFNRAAQASFDARETADKNLYACVIQTAEDRQSELSETYGMSPTQVKTAYNTIANAMYIAVRLGGAPCSGLPWRWGYGYENCGLFD
jgi:hypothetical protein